MNYNDALNFISSFKNVSLKPSLDRIKKLLNALGNPQNELKAIHIAGTNGKGSVAVTTANILKYADKKVGLFISPYVIDFKERIQINGEMINENDFLNVFNIVKEVYDSISDGFTLSQFEFITAMAFVYFKKQNCDFVVLETGLGGRFDATNVCEKPVCTVLTSISLDHTTVFGNSLEDIAYEKTGIIKKDVPLIVSKQEPVVMEKIIETAKSNNAEIYYIDLKDCSNISATLNGTSYMYKEVEYWCNLLGEHQVENTLLAVNAAKTCIPDIDYSAINVGLSTVSHPCRLEIVSNNPLIIIDGAHNPKAAKVLKEFLLGNKFSGDLIFGAMKDKDYKEVLKELSKVCKRIIAVSIPNNNRAASGEEILFTAKKYFPECIVAKDYIEALEYSENNNTLICGSLFLASDIRKLIIDK